MIRGRDVSHFQGAVNWGTLKAVDNLSFGMAKCTQGMSFLDSEYVHNRAGCHAAGLPFIAYHYAEPGSSSALAQVRQFVAVAGQVDGYCLDLEKSTLSQAETNAWMRAFGDGLRSLTSATTFVYLGGYAANGSGQGSVAHFDHWIYPHYTVTSWPTTYRPQVGGNTTGWKVPPAPSMWQCSDNIRGMDALVSPLTITELFSGADMPLSGADKAFIQDAVRSIAITSLRGNGSIALDDYIAAIDLHSNILAGVTSEQLAALVALTPESIATAVVAALPPAQAGGLTKQDVTDAVKAVFAQAGATS